VKLLTADTLHGLEEQATHLAAYIADHTTPTEPEPTDPLMAALTEGAGGKTRRRPELARSLHPRRPQERDEQGRYTRGSFDGGARTPPVPKPSDPVEQHDRLVVHASRLARERHGSEGFQSF
jgi:hypothetical protein